METLLQDVRYGFRMLRKSPGFAVVAVITLALGIGANTGLFSVINGVLLNPLPYQQPDRLITIYAKTGQFQQSSVPYLNFLDWQKGTSSFAALAAYRSEEFNLTGIDQPERLHSHMVSAGFFELLGVNPLLGRSFREEEDEPGATPVVLVGDGLWKRRFGSSREILGRSLTLNGIAYTVVGVAPGRLPGLTPSDVYVPIGQWNDPSFRDRRISMGTFVAGRLKPGVSLEQARADMEAIARNLAAAYPEADAGTSVTLVPLKKDIVGDTEPFLLVLLGAVGFVLLIACVNVSNLLLARSTGRAREFAIRAAVGASPARVIRQLLTESALLAIAGGALGLALAEWGTRAVLAALPTALPRGDEIALNFHVLVFALGVSLIAAVLFGLVPALKTAKPGLHETLKEAGRGSSSRRHRTQSALAGVEIAMALVLLIGAGLMIRSLAALWRIDPGFDPHNVLTFSLNLSPAHSTNAAAIRAAYREMLMRIEAIPGVIAASVGGTVPMKGDSELPFWRQGQPKPANDNDMNWALFYPSSPGYWKAMRISLIRGRLLTEQDKENSPPVIVIDESFARQYFPNEDPVGKRINLGLLEMQPEIVGVVAHVNHWGLGSIAHENLKAQLYVPMLQIPDRFMPLAARGVNVVARTASAPQFYEEALRAASKQFDRDQVVYDFEPMERIVSDSIAMQRFAMVLLGVFAGLALVLASLGIYGVVSYLVGQRKHEVGIRMALGAQRGDVLRLILGQGTKMALIGVGIGLAIAFGLTRLMASMLFGVSVRDPLTFLGVSLLLTTIACLACYLPARRAARVDPMLALRYE
jgi:putative ABC transport system permease protein